MRYFIIGFKGSGKTTTGKKLARILSMEFIDLDDHIEQMTGRSVPEIFSAEGETEFRNLEWKALKDVIQKDNIIVSTGGGVPCHCDNMNLMEKYGEVIYLRLDNDTLVGRLEKAAVDRPIVKNKTRGELYHYIQDLKNKCEHHYMRARYIVDGEKLVIEDLADILKGKNTSH
jgi:shikimate kinase